MWKADNYNRGVYDVITSSVLPGTGIAPYTGPCIGCTLDYRRRRSYTVPRYKYDALALGFITEERTRVMDMTVPMWETGFVVVALKTSTDVVWDNLWVFGMPFEGRVWPVLASMIIFASAIFWLLEAGDGEFKEQRERGVEHAEKDLEETRFRCESKDWGQNVTTALWLAFSTFTLTTAKPRSPAAKCFSIFWQFFVLVTITAYTANLASIFVNPEKYPSMVKSTQVQGIQSMQDLGLKPCISDGGAFYEQIKQDYPRINPVFVTGTLEETIVDYLRQGKCHGIVWDFEMARSVTTRSGFCDTTIADAYNGQGGIFKKVALSMGINRKNAGLAGHLSVNIMQARAKGEFQMLLDKHLPVNNGCSGFSALSSAGVAGSINFRVDIVHMFVPMMFVLGAAFLGVLQVCIFPSRGNSKYSQGESTSVYVQDEDPPPGMAIQPDAGVSMSSEQYNASMGMKDMRQAPPRRDLSPPSPSARSQQSEPVFLT